MRQPWRGSVHAVALVLRHRVRLGRAECAGRVCLQTVVTPESHLEVTPQHVLSKAHDKRMNEYCIAAAMLRALGTIARGNG